MMNITFSKWPEDPGAPQTYPCKGNFYYSPQNVYEYKHDYYVKAEDYAGYFVTDTYKQSIGKFGARTGNWQRTTRYRYEQAKYYGRRVI